MPIDLREVFRELTPPPGGLHQLLAHVDSKRRPGWPWAAAIGVLAPTAVAVALTLVLTLPDRPADPGTGALGAWSNPAVGRYVTQVPTISTEEVEEVIIPQGDRRVTAARKMTTASPNVVFYWIASVND